YRAVVHTEFRAVIASPDDDQKTALADSEQWTGIWDGSLPDEDARQFLVEEGCDDPERVLQLIQQSREGRAVINMQTISRARLDAFMPRLLWMLAKQVDGEQSLAGMAETLNRIVPLVESIARRSAYLVLLLENPTALYQLV